MKEYHRFIQQVNEFEHMIYEDGVRVIKLWFSITKEEQARRFEERKTNPLKKWKISPVDLKSRSMWVEYSQFIREMFAKTHTDYCPWVIVKTDSKKQARLESIRYVLSQFDYLGDEIRRPFLYPDQDVIKRFHRSMFKKKKNSWPA